MPEIDFEDEVTVAMLSVLELGPEEELQEDGRGGDEEEVYERERREASAVACFRLHAPRDAARKATRLMTPRDGRCGMSISLDLLFIVVRGLGYCQGAQA